MNMSPKTCKALTLSSSLIQAAFDAFIHHLILSGILSLSGASLEDEARTFLTGTVIVCFAFGGLYGTGILMRGAHEERHSVVRSGFLAGFVSVLFALTSEAAVPLMPVILSLVAFMAASLGLRYSLRHFVASKRPGFMKMLTARPAYGLEAPSSEPDTSLRKEYRYNMREILRHKSRLYFLVKRAFDVVSSGIALVVLSPVLLVTAVAIKLEDGGPVFFSAERYGRDMGTFRMLKFRSMVPDAESRIKELLKDNEMTGHTFKIKDDPRITRVGKFIRRYSIDELPQLWNVFTGDMSVVGPRPVITLNMETCDDYDRQRWLVRPGLTCYWQVSGRADVKWEQWIEMDLDYIENMSVWEDVKLILKTFPVVFKADGAY